MFTMFTIQERAKNKERTKKILVGIFLLLLFSSMGSAVYFYKQFSALKRDPRKISEQEVKDIVDLVSRILVLPEGEQPTVATVTDLERLKDQPFFARAKQGDKVLIYTNARKAILYNPLENKIVEVAPLNIGNQ